MSMDRVLAEAWQDMGEAWLEKEFFTKVSTSQAKLTAMESPLKQMELRRKANGGTERSFSLSRKRNEVSVSELKNMIKFSHWKLMGTIKTQVVSWERYSDRKICQFYRTFASNSNQFIWVYLRHIGPQQWQYRRGEEKDSKWLKFRVANKHSNYLNNLFSLILKLYLGIIIPNLLSLTL